jgi:deoxyribodipyrimidine photo-lyase
MAEFEPPGSSRVRRLNQEVIRQGARYVLYWSQMNRRVDANHALLFAVDIANRLGLPVLFHEGLSCGHPYASDRFHTFILEGVPETAKRLERFGIGYVFHLGRRRSDPNDVLYRLAADAAAVVTDDYPVLPARDHNGGVPGRIGVAMWAVDSSCIVPMAHFEKREYAAYTIRPKIQRALPVFLEPAAPVGVKRRYRDPVPAFHTEVAGTDIAALVASCDIDHSVPPAGGFRGGRLEAEARLHHFLTERLRRYSADKNEPSRKATSELSPYLHFGVISSLEVALAAKTYAAEHKLIADEFLEELIVRRELAFNFARFAERADSLEALPRWARATLDAHRGDPRSPQYTPERLEAAGTGDDLWNATQKELVSRGKIHGYYRMYWGKKIIEWSKDPETALSTMIRLNDKYALDGRDPNTYANILWCFGLHDRPWSERPIFGIVRYMSRGGTDRKTDVRGYIREIEGLAAPGLFA